MGGCDARGIAHAHLVTERTAASPELERLDPFVGVWNTTGEMKGGPEQAGSTFRATDTYEWLPGGHFLLHGFDADMPSGRVQGIEIIGQSPKSDSFSMHSFDSAGQANVMHGRVDGGTWTFVGEALRFTGGFRDGGSVFAGRWERRSNADGSWQPLMEVTLHKCE